MTVPQQRTPRTCARCGMGYQRGPKDRNLICQECRDYTPVLHSDPNQQRPYNMAAELVGLRLAVEMATAALRMGREVLALAALEAVSAPMRFGNAATRIYRS